MSNPFLTAFKPKQDATNPFLTAFKPKEEPQSDTSNWLGNVGTGSIFESEYKAPGLGEAIGQLGEAIAPEEVSPENKHLQALFGKEGARGAAFVGNFARGVIKAPFGIASWKADLLTNPKKAVSDMGEMIRNGLADYGQIWNSIKGDKEARQSLLKELEEYPVEKGFEIFMPLAMLLGVRKLGKGVSKVATDASMKSGVPFAEKVMQAPDRTHVTEAPPAGKLGEFVEPEIRAKMMEVSRAKETGKGIEKISPKEGLQGQEAGQVRLRGDEKAGLEAKAGEVATPELLVKARELEQQLIEKKIDNFQVGSRRQNSRKKYMGVGAFENATAEGIQAYVENMQSKLKTSEQAKQVGGKVVKLGGGLGMVTETPAWLPAKIVNVVKSVREPYKRLFVSMQKRGKTEPYKALTEELRDVDATQGVRRGEMLEDFRDTGLFRLDTVFRNESKELGTNLLNGKKPDNPKLAAVADKYYAVMDKIGDWLKAGGVMVMDADGKLRPFEKISNYFPRILKPEIAQSLFEDANNLIRAVENNSELRKQILSEGISQPSSASLIAQLDKLIEGKSIGSPEFRKVVKYKVEMGFAKSPGDAIYQIWNRSANDLYRPFSNVERSRISEMPMEFYNNDAQQVVVGYVHGAARAITEVERWGSGREGLTARLADVTLADPTEGKTALQMVSQFTGTAERLSPELQKWVDRFVNVNVATKIGLGTATIPNTTQLLYSTWAKVGWGKGVKGMAQTLTPSGRSYARRAGLTDYDVFRELYSDDLATASISRKAASSTTVLFNAVNKFNRVASGLMVREKLPQLHKWANDVGGILTNQRRTYARNTLKEWGIDYKQPLTDEVVKKAMYRVATESQLQRNVMLEPGHMSNPKSSWMSLFKRFQYRQMKWTKDNIIKEANHNPLPLMRLIAGGIVAGEGIIQAKEWLRNKITGENRERQDKVVIDDTAKEAAVSIIRRAANDLAAAGTMGLMSEFFDAFDPYKEEKPSDSTKTSMQIVGEVAAETIDKLKFIIEPVFLSDLERMYGLTKKSADYIERGYSLSETGKILGSQGAYMFGTLPGYGARRALAGQKDQAYFDKFVRAKDIKSVKKKLREWIKEDDIDMAMQGINQWNESHPEKTDLIPLRWIDVVQAEEKRKALKPKGK